MDNQLTLSDILEKVKNKELSARDGYRLIKASPGCALSEMEGAKPAASFSYNWTETKDPPEDGLVWGNVLVISQTEELAVKLRERGGQDEDNNIISVTPGSGFEEYGPRQYRINLNQQEDYKQLLIQLQNDGLIPDLIIHSASAAGSDQELESGIYSVFMTVQAFLTCRRNGDINFLYVYPTDGKPQPAFTAVSAFFKSLQLEFLKFKGKTLGCKENSGADFFAAVCREIAAGFTGADTILYQNDKRYVKKLAEYDFAHNIQPSLLKTGGAYLITGGIGSLGMSIAEFLINNYQADIILVSRSDPGPQQQEMIRKLQKTGQTILHLKTDITVKAAVENLMKKAIDRLGRLNGIIHCAGILKDSLFPDKSLEQFKQVIEPKVKGTMLLDQASEGLPLDFIMFASSSTAVLGNIGQSDYAYANSFMDFYTEYREVKSVKGLCCGKTISVNWPLLAGGKMDVGKETKALLEKTAGIIPLSRSKCLNVFTTALRSNLKQLVVFDGDIEKIKQLAAKRSANQNAVTVPDSAPGRVSSDLPEQVLINKMKDQISDIIHNLLKIEKNQIDFSDDMQDYGFDSVTQTRFMNEINAIYNFEYTPAVFYELEEPTLECLITYLYREQQAAIARYYRPSADQTAQVISLPQQSTVKDGESSDQRSMDEEKIAIIGISCVMPGSGNAQEFWENLIEDKELIRRIPAERLSKGAFSELDPEQIQAGFIDDVAMFDNKFFGISPREAKYMDPQQRILLEEIWHAFEDAGYAVPKFSDSDTGVFIGAASVEYFELWKENRTEVDPYAATGMSSSLLANRISYLFNFHGPSVTVDTACSSALTAICHAVDNIRAKRCRLAVAGGINILLSSSSFQAFGAAGMLNSDGKCKPFDEKANGYTRGEGCGVVILKPLTDAVRDHDHIYGIIEGTAMNHGGRANSLTAPNALAQAQLVEQAYENAGIAPSSVSYIETHGTGTRLGDPVEINGLKKAFEALYKRENMPLSKQPVCGIGSVKANIGHLEGASGIAGLIKVLLAMQHRRLPGLKHYQKLNPMICLKDTPFYIVESEASWDTGVNEHGEELPRVAGVSSFGFGGSNVHLVIREYKKNREPEFALPAQAIPVSAKSEDSLKCYLKALKDFLNTASADLVNLNDLAYTFQTGREPMPVRAVFIVREMMELPALLEQVLSGSQQYHQPIKSGSVPEDSKAEELALHWLEADAVDWYVLYDAHRPFKISLPVYPFEKKEFWLPLKENQVMPAKAEEQCQDKEPGRIRLRLHEDPESGDSYRAAAIPAGIIKPAEVSMKEPGMKGMIKELICEILHLPVDEIDPEIPMNEYGLDSIASVELAKKISGKLNTQYKADLIYEYPTVNKLSDYLVQCNGSVPVQNVTTADIGADDIAVIGMSGRFPGAENTDQFWSMLKAGGDGICEIPKDRWDIREFYDEDPQKNGKTNCRWGGFIDGIDKFDPLFFRISPTEAQVIDPQQRIFLEECYKALEDAGYAKDRLDGSKCGVYAGVVNYNEYGKLLEGTDYDDDLGHAMLGSSNAILASRISYFLNLKGPAMAIDTACSSSHVAIHLACKALLNQEIDLAVAGGVMLQIGPKRFLLTSKSGALSPTGKCRTFDNQADGYVPGEGAGAVVLKRLGRAVEDRDNILGIIKGSCVNQDGMTNGITAPSAASQRELELELYSQTGINPETISYVEAHGTGTKLGDPIEIHALSQAFGQYTSRKQFCGIGSVKTNIGHGAAAAGISAVIKVLLSMRHRQLAPSLNYYTPNEHIDFENSPFYVNTRLTGWEPVLTDKRRAAVSGFGLSGTNCHIIMEEPPEPDKNIYSLPYCLILLSAKSKSALAVKISDLKQYLLNNSGLSLADISYTLSEGRSHFNFRFAAVVDTTESLVQCLTAVSSGHPEEWQCYFGSNAVQNGTSTGIRTEISQLISRLNESPEGEQVREIFDRLARHYTDGGDLDLNIFFRQHRTRTVELPAYPFDRLRCWADRMNAGHDSDAINCHMDRSMVTADETEQIYQLVVDGSEFYLREHVIDGNKVFPAVAFLELAIRAGERFSSSEHLSIQNIVFAAPLTVGSAPVTIQIKLCRQQTRILFQIASNHDTGKPQIHSQGYLIEEASPAGQQKLVPVNVSEVINKCGKNIKRDQIYHLYGDIGVEYSGTFCSLNEICYDQDEALSRFSKEIFPLDAEFKLHPVLVDGLLQTTLGIGLEAKEAQQCNYLPYVIEKVISYGDYNQAVYGYAIKNKIAKNDKELMKFDIMLLDKDGNVLLQLKNLSVRATGKKDGTPHESPVSENKFNDSGAMRYYQWTERPMPLPPVSDSHEISQIMLFDDDSNLEMQISRDCPEIALLRNKLTAVNSVDELTDRADKFYIIYRCPSDYFKSDCEIQPGDLFYPLFSLVKTLARLRQPANILFLYQTSQSVTQALCRAAGAFAKSVIKELPGIQIKTIEQSSGGLNYPGTAVLLDELRSGGTAEIRYNSSCRNERVPADFNPVQSVPAVRQGFKEHGIYLITGGTGGLGLIFAEYLIRTYHAFVILCGRTEPDQSRRQKICAFDQQQKNTVFIPCDLNSQEQVTKLLDRIKAEYGNPDGVIHAAGIIDDGYIINKEIGSVSTIINPKIGGTIHLVNALKQQPLDLFIGFSAIAAVTGNAGQCDYAYGNRFMDEYLTLLSQDQEWQRHVLTTISINWPLWKEGGMRLDERLSCLLEQSKTIPLESADGISALETIIKSGKTNVAVFAGGTAEVKQHDTKPRPETAETDLGQIDKKLLAVIEEHLQIPPGVVDLHKDLREYGYDSINLTVLANLINRKYGLEITPALFFEADELTVHSLSELLKDYFCPTGVISDDIPVRTASEVKTLPDDPGNQSIAIIGISGRMPGSDDLEEFWNNLQAGNSLVTEIPKDRWDWREYYGNPLDEDGKTDCKWGAFLNDVDTFDAKFFNISRREAELMDPQQRIMLEVVWSLLENAGYHPNRFKDLKTGLYLGIAGSDYSQLVSQSQDGIKAQAATGLSHAMTANRISYLFDFQGPCEAINTSCSSSLVAVHNAVRAIRCGECEMAVAGGVNVILSPVSQIGFGKVGVLSKTGKCRTFDRDADGIVRGEGAGAVLLKKLSDARRDGDHIYAIIRETGVNHGGHSSSLTAPNPQGQIRLLTETYQKAGINPETISYIECHGTGTKLGDPVEINALKKAFDELQQQWGQENYIRKSCGLGSVKTNIGHLEAASGIAGLLKVVLAMKHQMIPGNAGFKQLNPYINLDGSPFYIAKESSRWETSEIPRRAGISSFGMGGTNAHVILEEYQENEAEPAVKQEKYLMLLSAKNLKTLKRYSSILCSYLKRYGSGDTRFLSGICYTFAAERVHLNHRLAIIFSNIDQLIDSLKRFTEYEAAWTDGFLYGEVKEGEEVINGSEDELKLEWSNNNYDKIAQLWCTGMNIPFQSIYGDQHPDRVPMPAYPFEKEHYWITACGSAHSAAQTLNYGSPEWQPVDFPEQEVCTDPSAEAIIIFSEGSKEEAEVLERKLGGRCKKIIDAAGLSSVNSTGAEHYLKSAKEIYLMGNLQKQQQTDDAEALPGIAEKEVLLFKHLVDVLDRLKVIYRPVKLIIVTAGTWIVNRQDICYPGSAAVFGFAGVVGREYPQADIRYYDLSLFQPGRFEQQDLLVLLKAVSVSAGRWPNPAAVRDGCLYERNVAALQLTEAEPVGFREQGVYLILGGTGGIGYQLAMYLAGHYHAKLVLLGRRAVSPAIEEKLRNISQKGGTVSYLQADASSQQDMDQAVNQTIAKYGVIHGAIHSAAVLRDRIIAGLTDQELIDVLKPKMQGSIHFGKALQACRPDFLLLFSSSASFTGRVGRAAYTAANTFQDACGEYLGQLAAYPVKVINWGNWDGIGMAADEKLSLLFRTARIKPIGVDEGMIGLERILKSERQQIIVTGSTVPNKNAGESLKAPAVPPVVPVPDAGLIEEQVITCLCDVLKLTKDEVCSSDTFDDMGVDSVLAIEIVHKLNSTLAATLRNTDLFNYPTVRSLTNYLNESMAKQSTVQLNNQSDSQMLSLFDGLWSGDIDVEQALSTLDGWGG